MQYRFEDRVPTESEHRAIAASVGWSDHFDEGSIGASIAASVRGVVVLAGDEAVGMARLVGDGVHYFYVQDVIVHPDHEGHGLGKSLVARLIEWVEATAPAQAFVGLFASPEAEAIYRELDFDDSEALGMSRLVKPRR